MHGSLLALINTDENQVAKNEKFAKAFLTKRSSSFVYLGEIQLLRMLFPNLQFLGLMGSPELT